ncbi:hypothetical protein BGI30_01840 [Snodgrassella alvi]|uniref:hypothetical protein n=1 Tax=Snodgrassella alvi TaxID=1196083 RepID=UPI000C1E1053|nr:hypothetical protein [Snodgrassella alvi]PIT13147.1 hypothetical protein BGI30_01840 [Snodgrassella alvi]PIT55830.1 hypothetical protein BHC59_09945 [Snodgrassella alvi]
MKKHKPAGYINLLPPFKSFFTEPLSASIRHQCRHSNTNHYLPDYPDKQQIKLKIVLIQTSKANYPQIQAHEQIK